MALSSLSRSTAAWVDEEIQRRLLGGVKRQTETLGSAQGRSPSGDPMTSQGQPGTFRRAIHRRHVQAAEMAAREMGGLSLADALSLCELLALAASGLAELRRGNRNVGIEALKRLLRDRQFCAVERAPDSPMFVLRSASVTLDANQRPIFPKIGGGIPAHRHTLVVERLLDLIKLALGEDSLCVVSVSLSFKSAIFGSLKTSSKPPCHHLCKRSSSCPTLLRNWRNGPSCSVLTRRPYSASTSSARVLGSELHRKPQRNVAPLTPIGAGVEEFPGHSPSVVPYHSLNAAMGRATNRSRYRGRQTRPARFLPKAGTDTREIAAPAWLYPDSARTGVKNAAPERATEGRGEREAHMSR